MKRTISPRDYQLLSEYVDEQLPLGQKTRLEKRLQTETDLQDALKELQQTKALLRSLPRMKAPRNFTLTPQMVGKKAPGRQTVYRWIPVFQYATVLATFLLILVLAGDILSLSILPTSRTATNPLVAQSPVAMQAPAAKSIQGTTVVDREAEPTATAVSGEQAISPASVEAMTTTITNTATLSTTLGEAPLSAQGVPTEIATGQAYAAGPEDATKATTSPGSGVNTWRWAEISLAVLALAGAFTTIYLRRRV